MPNVPASRPACPRCTARCSRSSTPATTRSSPTWPTAERTGCAHRYLTASASSSTFADTSKPDEVRASVRDNTRLFLTETPANPTMKLSDIAAISEIARAANAVHVVDNTFLTPYFQRALDLGADLSLHSTTKYFDGHASPSAAL
ncbi:MAG: PLP-dependent transferase [Woeseiaceae bacterium]|nr:PLP-dependent transferase [Woeseiaceae bacterium]